MAIINSLGNIMHDTTYYRILYPAVSCPHPLKGSYRTCIIFKISQIIISVFYVPNY